MSSGARVKTAFAKQTDAQTVPQTGWKTLPNITNGLSVSSELTASEMLDGGRIAKAGMVTSASVSGDIESELMFGAYDELLSAAFWSEWVQNRLTIGTTKKQFAITKDFEDINVNHLFLGCVASSFGITIDTSSLIKVKFGMTGLGYQESKTQSFAKTPTPTPDSAKASSLSIGTIKVDDADIGVCVEAFSLDIDNQTEVQKCLGNNIYGGNVLAMLANISGSMTIAYSQKAHDIVKNQLTGATIAIEVPINFAGGKGYVIKVPKAQVSGEIPSPSPSDLVTVELSFNVVDESPVIERVGA